jgi:CTP:molybdopterin cytidylyltransferase MocA
VTVAAIILAASTESALGDAAGVTRVRRLADVAWAGGAVPVIVVAPDPEATVAAALAGSPVTLAEPAPMEGGPVAQIVRGVDVALGEVRETGAALVWPARMCWVGPETVTSLIEAHGATPGAIIRPAYRGDPGWPALLPVTGLGAFRALAPNRMPDELLADAIGGGIPERIVDLGDPGVVIDGSTPYRDLPPYDGPPQPTAAHAPEWGAAVSEGSDSIEPLEGPSLAPYEPAGE